MDGWNLPTVRNFCVNPRALGADSRKSAHHLSSCSKLSYIVRIRDCDQFQQLRDRGSLVRPTSRRLGRSIHLAYRVVLEHLDHGRHKEHDGTSMGATLHRYPVLEPLPLCQTPMT